MLYLSYELLNDCCIRYLRIRLVLLSCICNRNFGVSWKFNLRNEAIEAEQNLLGPALSIVIMESFRLAKVFYQTKEQKHKTQMVFTAKT